VSYADRKLFATTSQEISGYVSVMAYLKFTSFFSPPPIAQIMFVINSGRTSLIGDVFISYGH
jgi:hypothetical protein